MLATAAGVGSAGVRVGAGALVGSAEVDVGAAVGSGEVRMGADVAVGSVLAVGEAAPQAARSRDRMSSKLNDRVEKYFIALNLLNATTN